jgi:hypothetical protein
VRTSFLIRIRSASVMGIGFSEPNYVRSTWYVCRISGANDGDRRLFSLIVFEFLPSNCSH